MVNCTALSSGLEKVPVAGDRLSTNVSSVGEGLRWLFEGMINGEPLAFATALFVAFVLGGIYYFTKFGAALIALAGFFLLALCTL